MASAKKKAGSQVGTAGKVFVLLLVVLLGVVICQEDGNNRSTIPEIGEEAVLWVGDGTSSVYVAPTKKYCERAEQLILARDNEGLSEMLRSGQVWLIPSRTSNDSTPRLQWGRSLACFGGHKVVLERGRTLPRRVAWQWIFAARRFFGRQAWRGAVGSASTRDRSA